jgi:hypothetical protein
LLIQRKTHQEKHSNFSAEETMAGKPTNIEQEPKKYEPSVKNPPYSNTRGSTNSATKSGEESTTG